jgi:PAS domain S-box-containing protein
MQIFILLLLGGLGLFVPQVFAQEKQTQIITLKNETEWLSVGKSTYILEDKSNQLTIEEVLNPQNQAKFQLSNQEIITHLPNPYKYWLKLTIQNLSGKEGWLELGSNYLHYIDFYGVKNGKYSLINQTGIMRPLANKAYPSNVFCFPVSAETKLQTVYIATYSPTIYEIPIHLGSARALESEKNPNDYVVGGFVGWMLVMFTYNLFLYLVTRDKVYVFYLGYVLTSIFSAAFLNNYSILHLFFPEAYQIYVFKYVYVWLGLPLVFSGFFAIDFLGLNQHPPIFKRLIQVSIFIFGGLIPFITIFNLIPFYQQVIFNQIATLFFLICLLSICFYLLIFKKEKNAWFYTLAWFWAIGGALGYLLCVNGILPYNIITRNSLFLGVSIETCLFALALADRINRLKDEKNNLQAENLTLIQNQNKILEQKITERTTEINRNQALLEETGKLARVGAWEIDWQTGKIIWSKVTHEIHEVEPGFEPTAEKNRVFYDIEDGVERFTQAAYQCGKVGKPIDIEIPMITAKGRKIWIKILGQGEYENGKCLRLFGIFQDIDERKRAEIEAQEIKEKLSSVFDSLADVVFSIRLPELKANIISPSCEKLFEIPQADFMENYHLWKSLVHPDDKPLIEIIDNALFHKSHYYHEYRIITPSGKLKWLGQKGRLIYDDKKIAIRIDGIISDITQQKQIELEAKEAKDKLASIFNSISEVVWSVSLPDYKMLLMTPSAVDLYGVSFDDFMADSSYWEKAIHPEDRWIVPIIYQEIASKGSYYQEYRIISTQGEVKWISNNGKVIFAEDGTPLRLDGLITNITWRKQIEETLEEEHKLFRTIIDNIPINIYVKDLLSRKVLANRAECEYMGINNEAELLGKVDTDIYPPESAEISLTEDKTVIETGLSILNKETLNTRLDGTKRWFLTSKIPMRNKTGEITGLVGISYDFTHRKEAEEQLKQTLEELQLAKEVLEQQAEEITTLNNHLETTVVERTRLLSLRNQQLKDYAFFNAHKLRAPIATILGLYQVMDLGITPEEMDLIIAKLRESIILLDKMVKKSQSLLDEVDDKDQIINPNDDDEE